jgi:hypothetical protein
VTPGSSVSLHWKAKRGEAGSVGNPRLMRVFPPRRKGKTQPQQMLVSIVSRTLLSGQTARAGLGRPASSIRAQRHAAAQAPPGSMRGREAEWWGTEGMRVGGGGIEGSTDAAGWYTGVPPETPGGQRRVAFCHRSHGRQLHVSAALCLALLNDATRLGGITGRYEGGTTNG